MSQAKPTDSEIDAYAGHYVLHGCQSSSFRVAFPDSKAGQKVIHEKASTFHKIEKVQERIDELYIQAKEIAEKKFELNAEYVAKRLKEIDELDILDIMRDDMRSFKVLSDWPKAWRISISGIDLLTLTSRSDDEDIESIVKKIKWPDKTKNLELIGKLAKVSAFSENLNITNNKNLTPWNDIQAGVDSMDKKPEEE